jgi:hypothetical protein
MIYTKRPDQQGGKHFSGENKMERDQDIIQRSIDELTEWQDNQYNPGVYMDGKVPKNLLTPAKPGVVRVMVAIIGILLLSGIILSFVVS